MAIRPEDRSKLIGIIVGIVAVNLFLAVRFLPRLMGGQPATAQQNAAPKPPVASTASTPAASGAQAAAGTLPPSAPVDAGTSAAGSGGGPTPPAKNLPDPFTPPHGTPMPEEPQPKSQTPPMVANIAPPFAPKLTPQILGPKPTTSKLPEIRLKGIIDGEPAVAVFQIDEETTYRQKGEKVAEGVRVAQISEAGVTLKQGKQNRFLDVGHSLSDKPSTPLERAPVAPPTMPAASDPPQPAARAQKPAAKRVAVRKSRAIRRQARYGVRKRYARAPRKLRRVVRRHAPRRPAFTAARRVVRRRI